MEALLNGKADLWRRRIETQRTSGKSIRAWCRASGTHEHSFYWWRSRLDLTPDKKPPAKRTPALNQRKPPPLGLARVKLIEPAGPDPLRLRLAADRELIFPASVAMVSVAELILGLEGKPFKLETGGGASTQTA
jgi:hypothetical protein